MAQINNYAVAMSFRIVGEAVKQYLEKPSWDDVLKRLQEVEEGKIEHLSLIGPEDEYTHMAVVGKPGNYHIGIFINEDEEYLFKASEVSDSKVDIAGDYWPEFQVCTNWNDLVSIAREFFITGKPSGLYDWVYFSEED